jgi:hypothetical protein
MLDRTKVAARAAVAMADRLAKAKDLHRGLAWNVCEPGQRLTGAQSGGKRKL